MAELLLFVSADGAQVAEADLRGAGDAEIEAAIADARGVGSARLWAYGDGLAPRGFVADGGFTRLSCESVAAAETLPAEADVGRLAAFYSDAYRGTWGHKRVDAEAFAAYLAGEPQLVHLVLDDIGVCRVDEVARIIDAPGVVPEARTTERYVRLLTAACARLAPGPATLESWGDPPERIAAHQELGFEVIERLEGWTLEL